MASGTEPEQNTQPPNTNPEAAITEPSYSAFSKGSKILIVVCISAAAFFSPVSSNIYFPALNVLAAELNVSDTLINLTLTSFLVGNLLTKLKVSRK
jgi:hypothetical protein